MRKLKKIPDKEPDIDIIELKPDTIHEDIVREEMSEQCFIDYNNNAKEIQTIIDNYYKRILCQD